MRHLSLSAAEQRGTSFNGSKDVRTEMAQAKARIRPQLAYLIPARQRYIEATLLRGLQGYPAHKKTPTPL